MSTHGETIKKLFDTSEKILFVALALPITAAWNGLIRHEINSHYFLGIFLMSSTYMLIGTFTFTGLGNVLIELIDKPKSRKKRFPRSKR